MGGKDLFVTFDNMKIFLRDLAVQKHLTDKGTHLAILFTESSAFVFWYKH